MNGKHKELVWQVHFLENDWKLSKFEFYLSGEMGSYQQKWNFPSSEDDGCLLKVKWAPDNDDGYLNFHSVSGDGRVSNWTLVKVLMIMIFFMVFMVMVFQNHHDAQL